MINPFNFITMATNNGKLNKIDKPIGQITTTDNGYIITNNSDFFNAESTSSLYRAFKNVTQIDQSV